MINYSFLKHSPAFETRKIVVLSLTLAVLIFASSCSSNDAKTTNGADAAGARNGESGDTTQTTAPSGNAKFAGEQLYTLYITNNKANDQLQKLLTRASGPGNNLKLVFQFYRDAKGYLRILVVPAGPGNSAYDLKDTVQPMVSSQLSQTLGAEDVFLGDLQLSNKTTSTGPGSPGAIEDLKNHLYPNNSGYEFIWFVPEVRTEKVQESGFTFERKYVEYRVTSCKVTPTKDNKNETFALSSYANPSPPRTIE